MSRPATIAEVVANDLCIACGLCESVTGGRVSMVITDNGSLRPSSTDSFTPAEHAMLTDVCPGIVAEARVEPSWSDRPVDPVWGAHQSMVMAWAGDPDVRFRAATGGVLTALGMFLVESGQVAHVVHVGADPDAPMRNRAVSSATAESVLDNTGSRYGPVAALSAFHEALERGQPFAVIAKPCDLGAVHRLSRSDPRVNQLCIARLAMVCGGSSRLTKSQALLEEFGVDEADLQTFRYRGYGNPGPTVVESTNGERFEKTYLELWEDETSWQIETRCKICPDALGEAADIAAADAWPGGAPTGEDDGFNAIVVRSEAGESLLRQAVDAGAIVLGEALGPRQFDLLQPHQVRKKEALLSRYSGMADAGATPITTIGLRVDELGSRLSAEQAADQRAGTRQRFAQFERD
jgi:coenzyme F420 hydrogenase subunit beta